MKKYFYASFLLGVFLFTSCSAFIKDLKGLQKGTEFKVVSHFEVVSATLYDDMASDEIVYSEELDNVKFSRGKTGELTSVEADEIPGFVVDDTKPIEQKEILEDGTTTVDVYYKRKIVSIIFNPDTGVWGDGTTIVKTFRAKYETPTSVIRIPAISLAKNTFINWSPEVPAVFPAEDLTVNALWSQTEANFTVEYYFEPAKVGEVPLSEYKLDDNKTDTSKYGEIGTLTNVTAGPVDGFEAKEIQQETILEDGSTVVKVYYARKEVTVAFIPNGGSWTERKTIKGKYGTPLEDPRTAFALTRDDYDFDSWDPEFAGVYPAKDTEYTAKWVQTGAVYTIEYLKEEIETSDYKSFKSETKKGAVGSTTTVTADSVEGFETPVISQVEIKADGTSVVTVKYARKVITLRMDPNGGKWSDGTTAAKDFKGKFGAAIVIPEPGRDDYTFIGWKASGVDLPATYPSENNTYKASWSQSAATYTINYFFEKVSGSGYDNGTGTYASKTAKGQIGAQTKVTATPVDGFEANTITQATITEDGSAVVNVYYNRKTITLTFDGNGGSWSLPKTVSGKYGAAVSAPSTDDLTLTDYKFEKWNPTVPGTFPAENATYTAQWKKERAKYTIKYYFEDALTDAYNIDNNLTDSTKKGVIGTTTTVTAEPVENYQTPVITQAVITEDDLAVVEVKYARKIITYTYKLNGGTLNSSSSDVVKKGKYGAPTESLDLTTISKNGFIFKNWDKTVPATYTEDLTFTAQWVTPLSGSTIVYTGNGDISLSATVGASSVSFTVTLPYEGTWTYTWYVDKVLSAKKTQNITETLSSGVHTVTVIATEAGKNSFTKTVSVKID